MRPYIALVVAAALVACGDDAHEETEDGLPGAAASASASEPVTPLGGLVLPPPRPFDDNPLDLPAQALVVEEGARLFVVPRRMLEAAELGSTLGFVAGRAEGREGDSIIVRVERDVPYPVHPAYVIAPQKGRIQRGALLIVAYGGTMHHAVAKNLSAGRVVVRITDAGRKLSDKKLEPEDVGVLPTGALAAGAQAVYQKGEEHRHVLLVSRGQHPDGKIRWLVLGRANQTELVEESELEALPPPRFNPRPGNMVRVAFRGLLVPAEVRALDAPGLYIVKRDRAGAPLTVGPGMLMPAPPAPKER
jgi:hypothetical protein